MKNPDMDRWTRVSGLECEHEQTKEETMTTTPHTPLTLTPQQAKALIAFLWPAMRRDPEHRDRVRTAWGTKTQTGLIACIERICSVPNPSIP